MLQKLKQVSSYHRRDYSTSTLNWGYCQPQIETMQDSEGTGLCSGSRVWEGKWKVSSRPLSNFKVTVSATDKTDEITGLIEIMKMIFFFLKKTRPFLVH